MPSQPVYSSRGYGGKESHLLPEEVEFLKETFLESRNPRFVATLVGCSARSVAKYFARWREEGVEPYPLRLEDLDGD